MVPTTAVEAITPRQTLAFPPPTTTRRTMPADVTILHYTILSRKLLLARRTLGAVDTAATIIPRVVAMERAKVAGNLEDEVPEFGWEDCWMQLVSNTAVNYKRL